MIRAIPGLTEKPRTVTRASPTTARVTAAAVRGASRRRSQTQPTSGTKATVVPTTKAEITTDVVCIPNVASRKPLPSRAPSTTPRTRVRRSSPRSARGRSASRHPVAIRKRSPTSRAGATSITVSLTTAKLIPQTAATATSRPTATRPASRPG